jgi:hypothetical protein
MAAVVYRLAKDLNQVEFWADGKAVTIVAGKDWKPSSPSEAAFAQDNPDYFEQKSKEGDG